MELLSKSELFPSTGLGTSYILRLDSGEELRGEVEKFCKEQGINAAWVNALGSCEDLELAYYNLEKKEYETKSFSEDLEITTVVGNIALKDNSPFVHVHGTFSNSEMSVIGGHINRMVVSATCEVSIWSMGGTSPEDTRRVGRKYAEATGLHLLCNI